MALERGARIGRFEVQGVLGEGGMGVVYEARDPDLDRTVAIKLIHAPDTHHSLRLLREAQALARLQHPNVVAVHEVGRHGEEVFVAMERIDGTSLDRIEPPPADWRVVLALFLQAAHGLAAAHAKGLVHRDVKPGNLLVGRDGRVRVGDFGLVRLADGAVAAGDDDDDERAAAHRSSHATTVDARGGEATTDDAPDGDAATVAATPAAPAAAPAEGALGSPLTVANAYLGTPRYMAPEQHARRPATAKSDQFSFCVALWEALAVQHPFERAPDMEWSDAVRADRRRPPPAGKAPRWLFAALDRGLAIDPAQRHPSMSALIAELERPRGRRWTVAAAALGLGTALGAGVLIARGGDASSATPPPAAAPAEAPPPLRVLASRRVTMEAGCEEFPSFTPDGRTLYYDAPVEGTYSIFAVDVAGGAPRRVTKFDGWDFAPAVSPDGAWLAFLRNEPATAAYVAPLPAGAPVRRLAVGSARPTWSPDGRHVWVGPQHAPTRVDVMTGAVHSSVAFPEGALGSLAVETPAGELLTTLFTDAGQGIGIALVAPGKEARWIERAWFEEAMTRLPGDRGVLVSRNTPGGKPALARAGFDGTFEVLAVGDVQARTGMSMSADGRRLAWSNCDGEADLALVDRDADGRPRLAKVPGGSWIDADPTGIPGTTLAVIASDRRGDTELWVVDTAGKQPARVLPSGSVAKTGSAVSPDGRWVLYAGGETRGLFVLALDGSGTPRRLTTDDSDQLPGLGVDGRVYFQRTAPGGRWDVMAVPFEGGEPVLFAEGNNSPTVSADGRTIAYVRRGQPYLRALPDGREERLTPDELPTYWRLAFSPDGAQVAIVSNERVWVVDRAHPRLRLAYQAGTEMLNAATFVGDRLLVGVQRWEGDLWVADVEAQGAPAAAKPAE